MQNSTTTCFRLKRMMIKALKQQTIEGNCTTPTQYKPQKTKPAQNRVETSQNSSKKMLRLRYKMLEKYAHMLSYLGMQTRLKEGKQTPPILDFKRKFLPLK